MVLALFFYFFIFMIWNVKITFKWFYDHVNALRDVHFFGHGASRHRRTVTRRGSSLASVDDGTKDNIWIKY